MKTKQTNYSRFGSVVHTVVYLLSGVDDELVAPKNKAVLEVQDRHLFKLPRYANKVETRIRAF